MKTFSLVLSKEFNTFSNLEKILSTFSSFLSSSLSLFPLFSFNLLFLPLYINNSYASSTDIIDNSSDKKKKEIKINSFMK